MAIAYQLRPCNASLAIFNPAVTTRNLLFQSHVLLYPFQANGNGIGYGKLAVNFIRKSKLLKGHGR